MELRIWTGSVERVILNADEETTSRDVIFALATITRIAGCYTLIGQQLDNYVEFLLTPSDKPLKLIKDRTQLGQPHIRFLLRHSKRLQPISQSNYQQRTLTNSGAVFSYRELSRDGHVAVSFTRRHSYLGIPCEWLGYAKKQKTENNFECSGNDGFLKVERRQEIAVDHQKFERISLSDKCRRAEADKSIDKNNNSQSFASKEIKTDPIELILHITKSNSPNLLSNSMVKTLQSTYTTWSDFKSEYSCLRPVNKEIFQLDTEPNQTFLNNDRKLTKKMQISEINRLNQNVLRGNSIDIKKNFNDGIKNIIEQNTASEIKIQKNINDEIITMPLKVEAINRGRTPSVDNVNIRGIYSNVIGSLDDYLNKQIDQKNKNPKKVVIPSQNSKLMAEENNEIIYQKKLCQSRMLEKQTNQNNSIIEKNFKVKISQYAEHVNSEIKDLKNEVIKNEIAAKQLENSIKKMQTNLYMDQNKDTIAIEKEKADYFFYPEENFSTLTADKTQINSRNMSDVVYETNESVTKNDSLNLEFIILLEDNRKGYLV